MKRKRQYIPLPEKLAATLACLLTQEYRDDLRGRKAPASEVLSLFHFDHIQLHAHWGSDLWWNLDPKLVAQHREKSKKDTAIAAKAKRIDKKWSKLITSVSPPVNKKHKWQSRKIQTRKFR